MKLKLDENIGERGAQLLRSAGHDVATVRDEKLVGTKDEQLFVVYGVERRALVTLDHDFGHALRFPPSESAGRVVGRERVEPAIDAMSGVGLFNSVLSVSCAYG